MKEQIYLDHAATTPLKPEVIELMHKYNLELYGNPSSLHSIGRKSKKLLKAARKNLAKKINAQAEEIVFTSGATEANNMVFAGLDYDVIITSPSEHPAVLEPAKASGKKIVYLNLSEEGFVDLVELGSELESAEGKALVSIMHGNNEIGTVQDIEAIGALCEKHNAFFHSDCVQTFSKLDIDVKKYNLDFLSVSAHKIHGPKGVGFLYKRSELELRPTLLGGGQEQGLRSGTENLVSILAMEKAVECYGSVTELKELQSELIEGLLNIPGIELNGPKDLNKRVPGNVNVSVPKLASEQMVLQLDLSGFCISSGSACSAAKNGNILEAQIISSYVLRACRLPEARSSSAIRLSLATINSRSEICELIKAVERLVS